MLGGAADLDCASAVMGVSSCAATGAGALALPARTATNAPLAVTLRLLVAIAILDGATAYAVLRHRAPVYASLSNKQYLLSIVPGLASQSESIPPFFDTQ